MLGVLTSLRRGGVIAAAAVVAGLAGCGDEEPTAAETAADRLEQASGLLAEAEAEIAAEDRYAPELAETSAALRAESQELEDLTAGLSASDAEEIEAEAQEIQGSLDESAKRADELAAPHPVGPLRGDGLGPVDFGAPSAEAMEAFGPPDREQEVGFGTGAPPRFDWIYTSEPEMRVVFDATSGELAGYSCRKGCDLETETGIAVGDSMTSVKSEYGSKLEDYAIGAGAFIVPAGRRLNDGGLIFTADPDGDTVIAIDAFNSLAGPAGD